MPNIILLNAATGSRIGEIPVSVLRAPPSAIAYLADGRLAFLGGGNPPSEVDLIDPGRRRIAQRLVLPHAVRAAIQPPTQFSGSPNFGGNNFALGPHGLLGVAVAGYAVQWALPQGRLAARPFRLPGGASSSSTDPRTASSCRWPTRRQPCSTLAPAGCSAPTGSAAGPRRSHPTVERWSSATSRGRCVSQPGIGRDHYRGCRPQRRRPRGRSHTRRQVRGHERRRRQVAGLGSGDPPDPDFARRPCRIDPWPGHQSRRVDALHRQLRHHHPRVRPKRKGRLRTDFRGSTVEPGAYGLERGDRSQWPGTGGRRD